MADTAPPSPDTGRVVPHASTEVLGLSLMAGGLLFLLLAGLISGIPFGEAAFLIPFILGPGIGAVLVARFGTWARVVGILLALATVAMTFFLAFGLFQPASFVEFTASVAYVLGVVLTLYGGIASLVRRNDRVGAPAASEVLLGRVAMGLVVLALVVSLPLWLVSRDTVDAEAASGLQEVTAANFTFVDITASAGESIVVRNADPFHHTFTIDALGIDVDLLPGEEVIVALPSEPGTYTYYCIPHSFEAGEDPEDMAATLTIQ